MGRPTIGTSAMERETSVKSPMSRRRVSVRSAVEGGAGSSDVDELVR